MGMGEASEAGVVALRKRLADGVSISSGLQQGGGEAVDRAELEDIVKDIAAALLGRDITIGLALPYPPERPRYYRRNGKVVVMDA